MGNTPYKELVTDRASVNAIGPDGCQSPKANLHKTMTYIRSTDYDLFDPPSLFYDQGANLEGSLSGFVQKYAINLTDFSTNGERERNTFPLVTSSQKILVAGDSVAAGAMIGDHEAISSQMQQRDANAQYVNLGVNGATAAEIVCRLESAGKRYNQNNVASCLISLSLRKSDPETRCSKKPSFQTPALSRAIWKPALLTTSSTR